MQRDNFTTKDYGKVLKHKLGFDMVVVRLDPRDRYDSFHDARFAYCRYHHFKTGDLQVDSFAAEEVGEWPKEEGDE